MQLIRFQCDQCSQSLKVKPEKAGQRAKCPKCKTKLVIPTLEESAARPKAGEAEDDDAVSPFANLAVDESSPPADDENPFSSFTVYDFEDESDYIYEDEIAGPRQVVDHEKLPVPRSVLYLQGGLLGVVALVCFVLGVIIGGFTGPGGVQVEPKGPFEVTGTVQYELGDEDVADVGAVVALLPKGKRPEQKVAIDGLRPTDPVAQNMNERLAPLIEVGARYTRIGADGKFNFIVDQPGRYLLLVISGNEVRNQGETLPAEHNAAVGNYFAESYNLIGQQKYELLEVIVRRDKNYPFVL